MVEIVFGLVGVLIGAILGASIAHVLAGRREKMQASRNVLSEELNKLYSPIEHLLELVGSSVEVFYWPHSSRWAHDPSVCNKLKAEIERTRGLAGQSGLTGKLGLTGDDVETLIDLVQLANDMAGEHAKGNIVPKDMAEKTDRMVAAMRGRILEHKLAIINSFGTPKSWKFPGIREKV